VTLSNQLNAGGFLRAPQVSINVTEFKSQKVSVMGQVTNAGQYALDGPKKVLDALAMAGGMLNDNSAAAEGTLVRSDGSRISIDFDKLLTGDPAMNVRIRDGRYVVCAAGAAVLHIRASSTTQVRTVFPVAPRSRRRYPWGRPDAARDPARRHSETRRSARQ